MNAKFLLPVIAGMFFALSAQAHDCSGGTEGGLDASGNQCNDASSVIASTSPSVNSPKAATNKASSSNKGVAKRPVGTRQASRSQAKQG